MDLSIGQYDRSDFDHEFATIQRSITEEACAALDNHGYSVIDDAFAVANALAYKKEISFLAKANLLSSNRTAFMVKDPGSNLVRIGKLLSKPNIFEAEMLPEVRCSVPMLQRLFEIGIPLIEVRVAPCLVLGRLKRIIVCELEIPCTSYFKKRLCSIHPSGIFIR